MDKKNVFIRVFNFYYYGFKNLSLVGKRLWLIILIKLFVMFALLRLFFFPDFLGTNFENDEERSDYVIEQLTNTE